MRSIRSQKPQNLNPEPVKPNRRIPEELRGSSSLMQAMHSGELNMNVCMYMCINDFTYVCTYVCIVQNNEKMTRTSEALPLMCLANKEESPNISSPTSISHVSTLWTAAPLTFTENPT